MKQIIAFLILLIFFSGCINNEISEKDLELNNKSEKELMDLAEKHFQETLNENNAVTLFPATLIIKKGEKKAFWPAFFNSSTTTLQVKILVTCENVAKIVDNNELFYSIDSNSFRAFHVEIFTNNETPLRKQECIINFFNEKEKLASKKLDLIIIDNSTPLDLNNLKLKIIGDTECINQTNAAIDLLKNKDKNYFDFVEKYIGVIECTEAQSGMHAWEKPPRFQVGKATRAVGIEWYAGSIVHDACHSQQYKDYLSNNSLAVSVPTEIYYSRNAEAQCIEIQTEALKKMDANEYLLNYLKTALDSNYWEVDYNARWW